MALACGGMRGNEEDGVGIDNIKHKAHETEYSVCLVCATVHVRPPLEGLSERRGEEGEKRQSTASAPA